MSVTSNNLVFLILWVETGKGAVIKGGLEPVYGCIYTQLPILSCSSFIQYVSYWHCNTSGIHAILYINEYTSTLAPKKKNRNNYNNNNIKSQKKLLSLCSRISGTFQRHFGNIWENVRWIIHNQTHKAETNGMGFVEEIKCQVTVQSLFSPGFCRPSSLLHK